MNATQLQQALAANPGIAKEAHDCMQAMLVRSATDPEFRGRMLSDPRAAIAEFTGRELPAGYRVKFVENKGDVTIVLPAKVKEGELSENELETVSGGIWPYLLIAGVELAVIAYQGYSDGQEH